MNKLLGLAQPQGYYTLADRIAESSIKKSSRTLIQQALKSAVLVRTGYLTPSPTVLMMDMEKGQPIANFRESRLKRLLILQSLHATPQTERILANVGEAVCHQKHFLRQLDVAQVKQLYQNHLSLERRFFEDASSKLTESDYQAFLLADNKLYLLSQCGATACFVYRKGRLLEFQLQANQCLTLENEDFVLLGQPEDMRKLRTSKAFRHYYLAFSRPDFTNPLEKKGFQKLQTLLKGPLIGLYLKPTPPHFRPRLPALPKASVSPIWIWACYIVVWAIALLAIRWLNGM